MAAPLEGGTYRYEITVPAGGLLASIMPGARITIAHGPSEDRYTVTVPSKPLWIAAL